MQRLDNVKVYNELLRKRDHTSNMKESLRKAWRILEEDLYKIQEQIKSIEQTL